MLPIVNEEKRGQGHLGGGSDLCILNFLHKDFPDLFMGSPFIINQKFPDCEKAPNMPTIESLKKPNPPRDRDGKPRFFDIVPDFRVNIQQNWRKITKWSRICSFSFPGETNGSIRLRGMG
jgi:hypothetical protein